MNDEKKHHDAKQGHRDDEGLVDAAQPEAETATLDRESGSAEPGESEPDTGRKNGREETCQEQPEDLLTRLLQEKEAEVQEKHDRWLRAQAEYENYRKRAAREKADLLKFGNERLMKELLPILDNFERSLEHAQNAQNVESIMQGIELIHKALLTTLEKFGLQEISAKGEKFDPGKHEATARFETAEYPEGTVVEQFQKGYYVHDRLLRPAMVAVAASPKEAGSS